MDLTRTEKILLLVAASLGISNTLSLLVLVYILMPVNMVCVPWGFLP